MDVEIYYELSHGMYTKPKYKGKVPKLLKALYGLKQSPGLFYKFFTDVWVGKLGFKVSPYDESLFPSKIYQLHKLAFSFAKNCCFEFNGGGDVGQKEAAKEALYLSRSASFILSNLGSTSQITRSISLPTVLVDNQGAIKLAENPEFDKQTKHIAIAYHFTREAVRNNELVLTYVPTKEQLADWLTKPLSSQTCKYFMDKATMVVQD